VRRMLTSAGLLWGLLVSTSCFGADQAASAVVSAPAAPVEWTDPAAHKSAFVTVNGIRMNYLDWGGSGPVLILIHGHASNPHIFDDLAPALTDRFRVIAYARRGHGDTEAKPPYDLATLTEDLRGLMDGLHIAKADLAGWSMGGDEISTMAASHPERVNRIVYLEGAYDWADPQFAPGLEHMPEDLSPTKGTLNSIDAFRDYVHTAGFPGLGDMSRLEAFVRDQVVMQPDGRLAWRANGTAIAATSHTLRTERRQYTTVHVPALAIYATTFLDVQHGDSATRAKHLAWEQQYFAPFQRASMARVKRELRGVEVLQVPGTHGEFLFDSRDQVVAAMRRFLVN
jgi:pimeloyl-ACP methyl ester carboxylesterase